MARLVALLALAAASCGSDPTPAGTSILLANVEEDLPPERRSALVGVLTADPVTVSFPDGEGSVDVVVTSARQGSRSGERVDVDMASEPDMLRSIEVTVNDAAGHELRAELVGNPTNTGSAEAPEHTRIVQVTRTKSGLAGTSMSQMSLRVRPSGVERL